MTKQAKHTGVPAFDLLGKLASCKLQAVKVDCETFVQNTIGPDAVELIPSYNNTGWQGFAYRDWTIAVHDTNHDGTLLFVKDKEDHRCCEHFANHELFLIARSLSPLTKLEGSSA